MKYFLHLISFTSPDSDPLDFGDYAAGVGMWGCIVTVIVFGWLGYWSHQQLNDSPFSEGTIVVARQYGEGVVTIAAGGGVSINGSSEYIDTGFKVLELQRSPEFFMDHHNAWDVRVVGSQWGITSGAYPFSLYFEGDVEIISDSRIQFCGPVYETLGL